MLFLSRPAAHFMLLVTILALSASAAFAANGNARMSDRAAEHAQAGGPEMVDVIVQYREMPGQAQANHAAGLGGETKRTYGRLPMRAMRIPAHALNALANGNGVKFVNVDGPLESYSIAARATANMPPRGTTNAGFRGVGVGVAVIDWGVFLHDDQETDTIQYSFLNGQFNTPGNSQPLIDDFGHGTHVAGIIRGSGSNSDQTRNKGVAR